MWYLNPWRLFTLLVGLCLLLYGADYYQAPDWDWGISFWMAGATYAAMPWFDKWIRSNELDEMIAAAVLWIACVDTVYCEYLIFHRMTLEMRGVNFGASTAIFGMCWVVWCLLPEQYNQAAAKRQE